MTKKTIIMVITSIFCISINLFFYDTCGFDFNQKEVIEKSVQIAAEKKVDDVIQGANDFLKEGQEEEVGGLQGKDYTISGGKLDETSLINLSNTIYNFLLAFAIVAAVVVGMIIGIRLIVSSVDEKAKIKEAILPYSISCIVIFGAFGIWWLAVRVLSSF